MNDKKPEYGVIASNCLAPSINKTKVPHGDRTLLLGSVVKIEGEFGSKRYVVRLLKDGESWESITFAVEKEYVIGVHEKLWPFLAAVTSPIEKVNLAKDRNRCEKLMHLGTEMIVGFKDLNVVLLGTIKFIGNVKGIGKCFGITLHEKKPNNKCTGSCAGIQYFNCLPGLGIFTTIEQIVPPTDIYQTTQHQQQPPTTTTTDIDECIERNVSRITIRAPSDDSPDKPHHEEIVTRYMDYPRTRIEPEPTRNSYFRTSLSLQNILDPTQDYSVNTTNDFDQNSVIGPDKTYLLRDTSATKHAAAANNKTKSEVDLIEAIGGTWAGTTDQKHLEGYGNLLRRNFERNEHVNNHSNGGNNRSSYSNGVSKNTRNKSMDLFSHLLEGSKTLPRKTKLLQECITNGKDGRKEEKYTKLNERTESKPSTSHSKAVYHDPEPGTTNDFTVGSLVEVSNDVSEEPLYGVIRWMGAEEQSKFVLVGVELEEEQSHLPLTLTDGAHNGERFFKCAENRALFVPLRQCHRDSRFQDGTPTPVHQVSEKVFDKECPVIQGSVAPLCMPTEEDVEAVCGKFRGIQGHHNSCYLDVTLFAMFTYTAVFDSLLFRPKGPNDIPHYEEVQRVLREEIVNPLRKNLFVRADRVMNLRRLLDQLSSVQGLTCEEKDPEEFLNSLLAQILKAKPFLKLNSGQEAYHYQLFVEKDDGLSLPTVQQLFEQSFLTSDIKLKEVPSCLIIQMPRFGKSYKMYPRILPSQLLDVTDVIEDSPRQCIVCGKLARWECRECFGEHEVGLESTAFCTECRDKTHCHVKRAGHHPKPLKVSPDFAIMEDHCPPPRLFMELFAVICIETSHYVAFVKCGVGHEAPWCFFDSMADRKGEKNGYNIPEMVACPDISKWLSDEQACRQLHANSPLDRHLPEHARRLLCDAYICMYQSPDVMMYR